MDMEDEDIAKKDSLLDAINDPVALDQEELKDLLSDLDDLQDARLLLDCRQAFTRERVSLKPDVGREWDDFRQKRLDKGKHGRQVWMGVASGVAASVLLFLVWQWMRPVSTEPVEQSFVAFAASEGPRDVILSTGDGQEVSLSGGKADSLLRGIGVSIQEEGLSYARAVSSTELHTLTTPRCGAYELELEDGTRVWLNAESRLVYPSRFPGDRREVELHGEGFFKVAPDPGRPFMVRSGKITAEVLGTEFNVRTYAEDDSHVTLLQGSVRVKSPVSSSEVIIQPGQDAFLQGDGTFEVREVDTDNYYLWTEGYFYFDNESVVEIMRELGRWYNIRVEFKTPGAMGYRLHFLAERDQKVEEVLQLLNMMGKVKATYADDKITIE